MYRLCNPADPTLRIESDDLSKIFDFRTNIDLLYRGNLTPSKFYAWLRATVTDDTFESHLAAKVRSFHGYDIDSNPGIHTHQLYRLMLQDAPKWLIEFISLSFGSRSVNLRISVPMVTTEPEGLRYLDSDMSFVYNGMPSDIYADNAYDNGNNISLSDETHAAIKQFLDNALAHFQTYLTESVNAHQDMDYDYLSRCTMHCRLLTTMFKYVTDRGVIAYSRAGRDSENIRVTTAFNRYTVLPPDVQARATITAEDEGGGLRIWYIEPRSPATREQLSTILNYTTNVLDFLPFNIRGKGEQNAPLYGVELEACSNYHPSEIIAAQQELFFIMKQDGSITGEGRYRYEMVTVPCTFKAHKRMWAEFFNKIDYTKFDTSKSTGNGMHVHIDRKAFKAKGHIDRFTWFFINPANFDFLFEVSERPTKNDLLRWAPLPHFREDDSKASIVRQGARANQGMRGTVHFKGNKTVEIRMFKGVVSYATVVKNLEFVDSVFNFTLEQSALNITLPKYLAWLNAQPKNRYQLIREFITQFKNIEQVMLSNELKEYLFATTKPESVLAKLKQAKFKVTNKHLTVLNREKRKRTYILDKQGNLQLAYSNGGKLASLDKAMQAKMTRGSTSLNIALV